MNRDGRGPNNTGPRVPSKCPVYLKKDVARPAPARDGRGGGNNAGRGNGGRGNRKVI